jgi:AcrR family transcriptional regulator
MIVTKLKGNQSPMARKADPNKKTNIIRSAIRVFAQKGYAATRIIDVAAAAGIGKGTIYEYFNSKEDLFFAVFRQLSQDSEASTTKMMASEHKTATEKLKAVAEGLINFWMDRIEIYSLTMEFWSATTAHSGRDEFITTFRIFYQTFRQDVATIIEEGMKTGEFSPNCRPYELASGLIGMLDALVLQAWLDSSLDAMKTARVCLDSLLRGLRPAAEKEM